MVEDKTPEELAKDLEFEREKIKRLEELLKKEETEVAKKEGLLNELYKRMMLEGATSRDEIANAIGREQYEALSYHLAKEHEKRLEVEKKLLEDEEKLKTEERKISEEEEILQKDEQKIAELQDALAKEKKKRIELEKQLFKEYPKPEREITFDDFIEDLDLWGIEEKSRKPASHHQPVAKDLVALMLRINRMKAIDASIMLNTTKQNVLALAKPLTKKGYLEIENSTGSDPTIRALKKLLDLKRR
ncbi:MAG: hypothetical protein FJY77_00360 [Candidatus Altiarchaeales archaeon]|nr:hypothetical protein [Candidatus Altiarchaeales archaeon]